jgi:hypothetical protein
MVRSAALWKMTALRHKIRLHQFRFLGDSSDSEEIGESILQGCS